MSTDRETGNQRAWAGNTFGNTFMLRWLIRVLQHSDVRFWYVFVALFVIPFVVLCARSGRIIYRYFRQRQGYGPLWSLWMTYKDHVLFSQVVMDKFAMYAGRHYDVKVVGQEIFDRLRDGSAPFVIFSSHIGCYELAGYTFDSGNKPFNALVYLGEKATVMENRDRMFTGNHIRMIPVKKDMSHLFRIEQALADGEIVSLPADRLFGSPRHVTLDFLGAPANFPAGPFSVAAMRGVDCITINVMKTSFTGYTAFVHELHYDKAAPRKEQVRQLAEDYVAELEKTVRRFPAQWYNYYEFWKQ